MFSFHLFIPFACPFSFCYSLRTFFLFNFHFISFHFSFLIHFHVMLFLFIILFYFIFPLLFCSFLCLLSSLLNSARSTRSGRAAVAAYSSGIFRRLPSAGEACRLFWLSSVAARKRRGGGGGALPMAAAGDEHCGAPLPAHTNFGFTRLPPAVCRGSFVFRLPPAVGHLKNLHFLWDFIGFLAWRQQRSECER